jgi:hypothetical protein
MTDDQRSELRAILTRAATCEAQRQAAREQRDWPSVAALEDELRRLWRRHAELEARERVA